jgi:single-strand DNA-binding protein
MNKVFLIGNLTREPELTETASGVAICHFSIAVNRNYTGGDGERKTDYFNVTAWRGLGETIAKYAKKGKKVAVVGSIEVREYEDSEGKKRTAVSIIAQDVEFLSPRDSESGGASEQQTTNKRGLTELTDEECGDIPF